MAIELPSETPIKTKNACNLKPSECWLTKASIYNSKLPRNQRNEQIGTNVTCLHQTL